MIDAGDFWLGRFREDEVHGEAFAEVKRIFLEWKRPEPPWPEGTTFTEPRRERGWSSRTVWALTPSGVRYELGVDDMRPGERDPREAPPIIWGVHVDRDASVVAKPRVAQRSVTLGAPHARDQERIFDAYAGVPLGLAREYRVGQLSRPLREQTRVVSEGWVFR